MAMAMVRSTGMGERWVTELHDVLFIEIVYHCPHVNFSKKHNWLFSVRAR